MNTYQGYTESPEKIEARKQRILANSRPVTQEERRAYIQEASRKLDEIIARWKPANPEPDPKPAPAWIDSLGEVLFPPSPNRARSVLIAVAIWATCVLIALALDVLLMVI